MASMLSVKLKTAESKANEGAKGMSQKTQMFKKSRVNLQKYDTTVNQHKGPTRGRSHAFKMRPGRKVGWFFSSLYNTAGVDRRQTKLSLTSTGVFPSEQRQTESTEKIRGICKEQTAAIAHVI